MTRPKSIMLSAALIMAIGCQKGRDDSAAVASSDNAPTGAAEEHEHHHTHAPWYKPRSFADLVTSLEDRLKKQSPSARQRAQLMDIIGWIPEIAADSDLRRKDFEAAQEISKLLTDAMLKTETSKSMPSQADLEKPLAALRDLATRSNINPQGGTTTSAGVP
jgi:hypothetical protein